ncbi:MAG: RDD family protein [Sphingomonadaceae bacterium]|nr:RDD family protein [Sphingomonadaceae bacterium]
MPKRLRRSGRDRILITPEGIALPITLASRGARAGALVLDLAIIGFLQIAMTIALIAMAGGFAGFFSKLEDGSATVGALEFLFVIWILAIFLFRNAYFLFFELGARGATPGKRMTGIRIASRDGGRLSVEMVIARNLLRDIELFLPIVFISSASGGGNASAAGIAAAAWFLVFALFPFWNRDRLRAGDIIAGTWVVEKPHRKLAAAMSAKDSAASGDTAGPQGAYRFSDEELDVYGEYELQTLENILRENRTKSLSAVHRAIARKIGRNDGIEDERAFLDAYYTQLRARLEVNMRMGHRKADKHA